MKYLADHQPKAENVWIGVWLLFPENGVSAVLEMCHTSATYPPLYHAVFSNPFTVITSGDPG